MDDAFAFDSITRKGLEDLLQQYPSTVAPKLHDLDVQRYQQIPEVLASRKAEDKDVHLTIDELTTLVDWKLAHGTFRPSLKKLVSSNSDQSVQEVTRAGFALCSSSADKRSSISKLVELKGIGPATASLLLSVYDPVSTPFFSDELYRWSVWSKGPKTGWDRPIKYTPKEYFELFGRVQTMRSRLDARSGDAIRAVDVERAAYVLGKRATKHTAKPAKVPPKQELSIMDPLHDDSAAGTSKPAKRRRGGKGEEPGKAPPQDGLGAAVARATRSSKRLKSR